MPLLSSSGSKANKGCYEYHFLTKGIDKCFLVVQVVLVGKKMYERNRPLVFFQSLTGVGAKRIFLQPQLLRNIDWIDKTIVVIFFSDNSTFIY